MTSITIKDHIRLYIDAYMEYMKTAYVWSVNYGSDLECLETNIARHIIIAWCFSSLMYGSLRRSGYLQELHPMPYENSFNFLDTATSYEITSIMLYVF